MANAIWYISFELKKGVSVDEFLLASKKCHDEVLSKQDGFISWEVLRDGDTWIDLVRWDSIESAKKAETAGGKNPAAKEFYAFLNMKTCKMQTSILEVSH